ncbi:MULTISPECIES: hypothetical protein [Legionella]|uniref:Uncharacterized protein n=1 Tax=Legionella septentrionalis TaxID=2498109 RepID=A0A3S0XI03_9GAMM|nr:MULTISPECIES: hypothetical protein [Legionella]MCP0913106.1 hypothetical protein [Legionella sp. 27cVA30]RUQ91556.1 hypothetical protein EKM59_00405 [Legionella septentrionalis]RUQ94699.1 hypothetical protein ELY11_10555 [Legionella septentrionalis]RUR10606.1 hypothetical protein ELY14_04635 [Legionella septentrionalis]RUR17165.1 hypothetical protein ELY10_02115 [Legionella septentrionalis]
MNEQDEALTLSNPRLLSAIYFSLLAIIATIVLDTIFYALGVEQVLPLYQGILLAVLVAAIFGALFGKLIVYSTAPYRTHAFWWAVLMVLVALPVYDLGLLYLLSSQGRSLFTEANAAELIYLYFFLLFYSLILVGIWLALLAGVAAIYLRGFLVYYLLQSLYERRRAPREDMVVKTKTPLHGETTVSLPPKNNHQ